jgi:hypothetical protein
MGIHALPSAKQANIVGQAAAILKDAPLLKKVATLMVAGSAGTGAASAGMAIAALLDNGAGSPLPDVDNRTLNEADQLVNLILNRALEPSSSENSKLVLQLTAGIGGSAALFILALLYIILRRRKTSGIHSIE